MNRPTKLVFNCETQEQFTYELSDDEFVQWKTDQERIASE